MKNATIMLLLLLGLWQRISDGIPGKTHRQNTINKINQKKERSKKHSNNNKNNTCNFKIKQKQLQPKEAKVEEGEEKEE